MFTGIIEDIGKVIDFDKRFLVVETILDDIFLNDSVAVNGICLTVIDVKKLKDKFLLKFEISKETFEKTNFKFIKFSEYLNIERSLKLNSRLSGHIVLGHVDTTIRLLKIKDEDFIFELPLKYEKYIVNKCSVAIDGISLTVKEKYKDSFSVVILPYTLKSTNLKYKKIGDIFNLEVDILAKYIENFLVNKNSKITLDFLKKHKFI